MTVVRASARPTRRGAAANFTGEVSQDEVLVGQPPSRMRATVASLYRGRAPAGMRIRSGRLSWLTGVGRICIGKGRGRTPFIPPTLS
jgi:hypothetical protein